MFCVEIEIKCLRGAENPLLIMTVTEVWCCILWERKQSAKKEETRNWFSGLCVKKQTNQKPNNVKILWPSQNCFPIFFS